MRRALLPLLLLCCFCTRTQEQWEEMPRKLEDTVWASSEFEELLGGRRIRYPASNLFDGSNQTCWAEAAEGNGVGESVTFITNRPVLQIVLVNGFARNADLYRRNGRVKRLGVYLVAAFTAPGLVSETDYYLYFGRSKKAKSSINLEDTPEPQTFDFPMTSEEQENFLQVSLEQFLEQYPEFAVKIEEELGYHNAGELYGRRLAAFFRDATEAFSMLCVKIEIEEVYRGSEFPETCLTELKALFD
jgi:hypothetical protein